MEQNMMELFEQGNNCCQIITTVLALAIFAAGLLFLPNTSEKVLLGVVLFIIIPLIVMGVMVALRIDATITTATVIAVSAPVAAFTTMMASKYGRDTELSAGIVSASALFSLITMPLVVGLTQYLLMK